VTDDFFLARTRLGRAASDPARPPLRLYPQGGEYILFPAGTPWQVRVQTIGLWVLAIAAVAGFLFFTEAGQALLTISRRELAWVSIGVTVLFWVIALVRRPSAWRKALAKNPSGRLPPLVWRLAIDAAHLAVVGLLLAFFWLGIVSLLLGLPGPESGGKLAFILGMGLPPALERICGYMLRRLGWVIPSAFW
jgi:hypothetical protein